MNIILQTILKFLKNNVLILGVIAIVLLLYLDNKYLRSEVSRLNNNVQAIKLDNARQQELTKSEFKDYYKHLDSIANKLQIKTKNITNVIVTKYNVKDTVIKHYVTKYDSITNSHHFDIQADCYTIRGYYNNDDITTTYITSQDKQDIFLYKAFKKRFLFIKWSPYYTAKVYSECKQDTVSVIQNIKILK